MSKASRYADDAPLTDEELRTARPASVAFPDIVAAYKRGELRYRGQRGAQKAPTKAQVTLRIDRDILKFFKSKGEGWQTRINDALAAYIHPPR